MRNRDQAEMPARRGTITPTKTAPQILTTAERFSSTASVLNASAGVEPKPYALVESRPVFG
jgi:hypothetical protein